MAAGKVVKALYTFKGSNNDELCFRKGDMITITQIVDGGWWEGTLSGKTGWFPSNYVTDQDGKTLTKQQSIAEVKRGSMVNYHLMVVQNLNETEKTYVSELHHVTQAYLHPILSAGYLTAGEYSALVGNIEDLLAFHQEFYNRLDECASLPHLQQRIGGTFLKFAPQVKIMYETYFANHPWAVQIMLAKKDDLNRFMESKGLPPPGTMELTTCLSKPFSRLEQYASLLKELERHIEDCHPDRGDTQRALAVCKEISVGCNDLRKQKEVECEIMSGNIEGCGEEVTSSLGQLVYLGSVTLLTDQAEKRHGVLGLFQNQALFLYISSCMSGYEYQGKLPVSSLTLNITEDSESYKHSFDLASPNEKRTVICSSSSEKKKWLDVVRQHIRVSNPAHAKPAQVGPNTALLSPKAQKFTPDSVTKPASSSKVWSMTCLRPSAPLRPTFYNKDGGNQSPRTVRKASGSRRKAVEDMKTLEDDAVILQVIEAYCTSSRTRHTVNSCLMLDNLQVMIVEDEKIIVDDVTDKVEEKSLVDTIYSLRDQLTQMKLSQTKLRADLNREVKARQKWEALLRKTFRGMSSLDNGE